MSSNIDSQVLHNQPTKLTPRATQWRRMNLLRNIALGQDGIYSHLNNIGWLSPHDGLRLIQAFGNPEPTSMRRKIWDYHLACLFGNQSRFLLRHFAFWTPEITQLRWAGFRNRRTVRMEFCFCPEKCWGCDETTYLSVAEICEDLFDEVDILAHFAYRSELYSFDDRPKDNVARFALAELSCGYYGTTGQSELDPLFSLLLSKMARSVHNRAAAYVFHRFDD